MIELKHLKFLWLTKDFIWDFKKGCYRSIFFKERCFVLAICTTSYFFDDSRNLERAKEILDFLFSSKNHLTLTHCLFPPSYKERERTVSRDGINWKLIDLWLAFPALELKPYSPNTLKSLKNWSLHYVNSHQSFISGTRLKK